MHDDLRGMVLVRSARPAHGWLDCRDRALLERLERHKHYTSICSAGPSEHLATIALGAADTIRARNRSIIAENLPQFDAFFESWPDHFDWHHPREAASRIRP